MLPGFYLQHKPVGATSFDLVRQLQAEIAATGRPWPSCHAGVLDPFAEGLLVLLVGQATRLMDLLHPIPKTYEAVVHWGTETDSGDALGQVVSRGDASTLTAARLDEALTPFLGWTEQVPPATSNKRVAGERAYVRAHRGETVVLPPSRVYLHSARWLEHQLPDSSRLELVCRGGYYVRALARDVGRALGCGAHLVTLKRSRIGPWADVALSSRIHLTGAATMPWCRTRLLSDAEVGVLRASSGIEHGPLRASAWTAPSGYPLTDTPVLGIHREKLASLLEDRAGLLFLKTELRGGL